MLINESVSIGALPRFDADCRPHAVIIGGGLAGLSAAVELAERGWRLSVLEARPQLGGRAYSYLDSASGEIVDNGQHAMMGCYRHTLAFLRRIGAEHKLARQQNLRVEMVHGERRGVIAAAALPSPLHIAAGILNYSLLTKVERLRALFGGLRLAQLRRSGDYLQDHTLAEVLRKLGQSSNARACFWDPVAIATLNEQPERAAAAPFAEVLARAFFGSRSDAQFIFARVGLSDLYTHDARRYLEKRGSAVHTRAVVSRLLRSDSKITGVELRDGRQLHADAVVSAVPPRALRSFAADTIASTLELGSSPIVSAHLWLDRHVLTVPFVGLVGTTTQWLFNRSALLEGGAEAAGQTVSAVISAAHDVVDWDNQRIIEQVLADIGATVAPLQARQLRHAVVVREKHATISVTPQVERRRPSTDTGWRNFLLAGDWVQTGLPPTIESAVLSGQRAAARVAALRVAG